MKGKGLFPTGCSCAHCASIFSYCDSVPSALCLDASTASTTPSHRSKRRAGAADSPAAVELDDAQRRRAAARFRWLRGESAGATAAEPPPSARLTRPQLTLALSSLGLDVGERDVSDMLSCFDSGGGGGEGLSFADFLRLVQQLPSSVLD